MIKSLQDASDGDEIREFYRHLADPWILQKILGINQSTIFTMKAITSACWLDGTFIGNVTLDNIIGPGQRAERDITSLGWTVNSYQSSILYTHSGLNGQWRSITYNVYTAPPGKVYRAVGQAIADPPSISGGELVPGLITWSEEVPRSA